MRRALSAIVLNEHGVLSRVVGLFSGRGYNIDSLTVAPIDRTEFSRINIITSGDERTYEQIVKQLHKLIPTYKVIEGVEFVEKEMVLLKIKIGENLSGLDAMLSSYNGKIVHSDDEYMVILSSDNPKNIDNFLKTMKKYNPVDIARSGSVLLEIK